MPSTFLRVARKHLTCIMASVWGVLSLLVVQATKNRVKKKVLLTLACACLLYIVSFRGGGQVGQYQPWVSMSMPRADAHNHRHFKRVRDQELFIYSVIANRHYPVSRKVNIVFTVMDQARSSKLGCCVLLDNQTVFTAPAEKYFYYRRLDFPVVSDVNEFLHADAYLARQYTCAVPDTGHQIQHATLTSSTCSPDVRDYVPVHFPETVPGGLAICGKVAYGGVLDPEKLIEWFELQRILGVDKILLYNLNNPEKVMKVFRYYQNLGLLDLQPYELPGKPYNRNMSDKGHYQFHHDQSMAVLECRQRMAGYTYVLSHDLDEFIIPIRNVGLKPFFQEKMQQYQDAAGFFFCAEFFIYEWGASNPEEDMMLTRYRMATKAHWTRKKYVMLPTRTVSITTHNIFPISGYTTYRIGPEEAILHHYRSCPSNDWKMCEPENTVINDVMTRYTDLHSNVVRVRSAIGLEVKWNRKKA